MSLPRRRVVYRRVGLFELSDELTMRIMSQFDIALPEDYSALRCLASTNERFGDLVCDNTRLARSMGLTMDQMELLSGVSGNLHNWHKFARYYKLGKVMMNEILEPAIEGGFLDDSQIVVPRGWRSIYETGLLVASRWGKVPRDCLRFAHHAESSISAKSGRLAAWYAAILVQEAFRSKIPADIGADTDEYRHVLTIFRCAFLSNNVMGLLETWSAFEPLPYTDLRDLHGLPDLDPAYALGEIDQRRSHWARSVEVVSDRDPDGWLQDEIEDVRDRWRESSAFRHVFDELLRKSLNMDRETGHGLIVCLEVWVEMDDSLLPWN